MSSKIKVAIFLEFPVFQKAYHLLAKGLETKIDSLCTSFLFLGELISSKLNLQELKCG